MVKTIWLLMQFEKANTSLLIVLTQHKQQMAHYDMPKMQKIGKKYKEKFRGYGETTKTIRLHQELFNPCGKAYWSKKKLKKLKNKKPASNVSF